MAIVGGNLADIDASAVRLQEAGASALGTGDHTRTAVATLHDAIGSATTEMLRRFDSIASDLHDQIQRAEAQLQSSDWHGNAKEQAITIKAELSGRVTSVLGSATAAFQSESAAFSARSEALLAEIDGQFRSVMAAIDAEYGRLAQAAQATRQNFEYADQTIRSR
ncbi:MAG: hypothetical protein ACR2P0_02840 [Acidimicrobiales bacterium]